MADEELRAKAEAAGPEKIEEIAKEAGFEINVADLEKAAREALEKANPSDVKLSVEDMDKVAGGMLWSGEDASDGHEMGCHLTYHGWNWSKENNEWCKSEYYCTSNHYDKGGNSYKGSNYNEII